MKLIGIIIITITSLLILELVSGEIPTKISPAPSPDLSAADDSSDSPPFHAPTLGSPPPSANSPSPNDYSSPPQPKTEHSPSPSPSDSPSISPPSPDDDTSPSSSPSPSPSSEASDLNHSDIVGMEEKAAPSGGGGMSGGTKAGVAFGTIAAVCVVGLAGFVYKKRQDNIRRSRYGYAAREIL